VRAADAIYAGYVVHCPLGGYIWQAIHYLHGFRDAGIEPFFYEDTRHTLEAFDPIHRSSGADYQAGLALAAEAFSRAGFGDSWAFFDAQRNKWAGAGRDAARAAFASARILVNAGGVHRFGAPERAAKTNVYIDIDPAYTQIRLAGGDQVLRELLYEHDVHFTFGENIGSPSCRIPTGGLRWHPTRQPIAVDLWRTGPAPAQGLFTTIGTWSSGGRDVELDGEYYSWRKRDEWEKIVDLPRTSAVSFLLAMEVKDGTDLAWLKAHGWLVRDPIAISRDADRYREFVRGSRAEFTTAKDVNVRLRSGWFSDRSACYLAAGRPVVTQDTGFDERLPVGEGLFAWRDLAGALAAVQAIVDEPLRHGAAARRIAEEHFAAPRVIRDLLRGL
jgi:hypothetical protein